MLLKDFFPDIQNKKFLNHEFSGIAFNSNYIKKGNIFFAINGNKIDGKKFINQAIKKGAKTIISNLNYQGYKNKVLFLKNKNPRKLLSEIAFKICKKKPKNLIAVTGTNGKTSIANFFYQILNLNKYKVSSIGTLGISGINSNYKSSNTTFDPINLSKLLEVLKKKKIENVILEASSHGLKQHRLHGLNFNIGIFTNLSRDHLDYHKTYKDYLNSKLILFKRLMKKNSNIIYDNDLNISSKLKKISKQNNLKKITIGKNKSYLKIIQHKFLNQKQEVKFMLDNKIYEFKTKLIGKIQIRNLLMSILAAYKSNISLSKILDSIEKIRPVKGRFEKVGNLKNKSLVILDYAHTPEALKVCLKNIKDQFKLRKINIVFGCGGERDKPKRKIMGKIANDYCNKIYLTDDNPRKENPKKIRNEIKKNIIKSKLHEIQSREIAIKTAIQNLKTNEILIVAGKGHENIQEYKTKKKFSDKRCIITSIKQKNKKISNNLKTNILSETLKKKLNSKIIINEASINSKKIKKNDIFFGIRGKKIDGNKFADEATKKGASLSIVDKKYGKKNDKKFFVKNSVKFFSECAQKIRIASDIFAIAITGSSGKTSLKELLGQTLNKIYPTTYSFKSFNNKYGVPISLFNINKKDKFGVFEIGMDKKGEIDYLSSIVRPNIGVITNISYAHIKNFKNLKSIAKAKSEIIDNIANDGSLVLNSDAEFFNFFKLKAEKKKINIISFGRKNKSNVMLKKILRKNNKVFLFININGILKKFTINKNLEMYVDNILASLAVMSKILDIKKINKKIFYSYKLPEGRGDKKVIKISNKKINLIDESYNSNPLSLNFAVNNFNKINVNFKSKYILLGDMLELGKFSKRLHKQAAKIINQSKINKVFVYGKHIKETFNKIKPQKRGRILKNKEDIYSFMHKDLKNNDYLMIKGSNATGLNKMFYKIKLRQLNAL